MSKQDINQGGELLVGEPVRKTGENVSLVKFLFKFTKEIGEISGEKLVKHR